MLHHKLLLKGTQLNGGAEQPLQWGECTLQNSFWLLLFSRQGRNLEETRSIFYDKFYHIIFLVDFIIKTALYICEAFYFYTFASLHADNVKMWLDLALK